MDLKSIARKLRNTPLHPQWLVFRDEGNQKRHAAKYAKGNVLDIGCSNQGLKKLLPENCSYIGLDYPGTADTMYKTQPMVFGDAQSLPIKNNSIDTMYMLEVLEHIPNPDVALIEIRRTLKHKGTFWISIPFLYPIHDAPFDFQRFTIYGLRKLLEKQGFQIIEEKRLGNPSLTAALLTNLAIVKTTLNALKNRHISGLLIVLLPFVVPVINLLGWFMGRFSPNDEFMPHGYLVAATKVKE